MRKSKNISLKQIAELAEVSVSSVSQILNNKSCDYSSEKTRERVRKAAAELKYRKNFGYRLLHGQATHATAILISLPRIGEEEYIRNLLLLLLQKLDQSGYASYVVTCGLDAATNYDRVLELISRGVEHFILVGHPRGHTQILREIEERHCTYVLFNDAAGHYRTVTRQSVFGREAVFRYFRSRVGEDFRMVVPPDLMTCDSIPMAALENIFPGVSREELGRRFMLPAFLLDENNMNLRYSAYEWAYRNIVELAKANPEVKALAFMNDDYAIGAAAALQEAGYAVGKDILIAGFNNNIETTRYLLPVSSIEINIPRAAELLIEEAMKTGPCKEECGLRLVVREPGDGGRITEKSYDCKEYLAKFSHS